MLNSDLFFEYSIFQNHDIQTFTTTSRGGVSKGSYASLNLNPFSADCAANVLKNRSIIANHLGLNVNNLFTPHQIHEDKILLINKDFLSLSEESKRQQLEGIDAVITQEKGICIGVSTADCVPVLVYDPDSQVLATIHAGWKGTVKQIVVKTVRRMMQEFGSDPKQLIVGIGPSISQEMFEVGDEVGEAFVEAGFDLDSIAYRNAKTGKLHIDLWKINADQLIALGVQEQNIEIAGICTYRDENFFSARRQTIHSGRMITGGVLR